MYNLPTTVDPNKIFLINRSELEGRIDPEQYHAERIEAIKKIKSNNNILRLKDVLKSAKKTTTDISETDVYIGLENIASNTGEYILTNDKQSISSANIFKKGQILFSKLRPYLNKVHLAEFDGICSTEFHVFESEKFNNEFLAIYLRSDLIVHQTKHLMTGNTLPRLQTEDISNLPVPILPIEVQNQIVSLYQTAYAAKQQKEAEAKALLESINTYLLGELGISLEEKNQTYYFQEPEPRYGIHYEIQKDYELNKTNKLVQEGKIFLTNFSEVTGGRYDPKLYDHNTKDLKRAIENNHFKNELLKNLITQSAAGDWGKDENEVLDNDLIKCLVIRATEFDNQYNLRLDNSRVKYRWIHKDKLARIDIKENDLLIEKSGGSPDQPVGRIAIVTKDMIEENRLCYSNFIHKIRVDNLKVNPEYLFYLLKTFHNIKLTDSMQSQTNGIRNLIMREYFNQTIPLPFMEDPEKSLKKQTEIANHIQNIRSQAKALQQEAGRVLEDARREVEKMILGE